MFTDIEGSTRLAHLRGEDWPAALEQHHRLIREVVDSHGAHEVSTAGDSFFIVTQEASAAIQLAVDIQRSIGSHDWTPLDPMRVRIGMHTGEALLHDDDYVGITVHAASRVQSAASGGQILLSSATTEAAGQLDASIELLDLGLHALKDLPNEVQLFQVVAEGLDRDFPPVRSLGVLRNNVPAPPSSFIGRTSVLSELHGSLDRDRVVTLTGPGGAGKTRLALKLATERLARYRDGVWFVELDPAHDETSVAAAVARVLRLTEGESSPQDLLDQLADHVRNQDVLIILDNCEHVIDAAASVAERLAAAGPRVHLLTTSREPLAIAGERVRPVTPLSTDDEDPFSNEAIQLLVDRITLVEPEFVLSDSDVSTARSIVTRLDGLPLAIELAAASAAELDLDEIDRHLDQRFELLTRGRRTALDRQKTLWGAIEWSHSLLDEEQRSFFRQLGVFPGEFDAPTVGGVLGIDAASALTLLTTLARKSLVAPTPSSRFRLLESIREFAVEQLDERGQRQAVAERHAQWFADRVAELREVQPMSAGRAEFFDTHHDDLVTAIEWTATHDPETALTILPQMQMHWDRSGRWVEGLAITEQTLAATDQLRSSIRVTPLSMAARLAMTRGDLAGARRHLLDLAELGRELGSPTIEAFAYGDMAAAAMQEGDLLSAEELYERALDAAEAHEDEVRIAIITVHLAELARQKGDLDTAWERAHQASAALQNAGRSSVVELTALQISGAVARARGDLPVSRSLFGKALAIASEMGDTESRLSVLYHLASLDLDDADAAAAKPMLREVLEVGTETDAALNLVETLDAVARLAITSGDPAVAARLVGAADALRASLSFPRSPSDDDHHSTLVAELRSTLGDAEWAAESRRGRDLTLEDAVNEALAHLDTTTSAS